MIDLEGRQVYGRWVEAADEGVQRLGAGTQTENGPGAAVGAAAQGRDQASSDDRRFPAAGAADQGDEVVVTQLAEEGVDGLLAAEEKASIFLTKRQQAAIGAQRLAQRAGFGGRLAAQAGQQHIELGGVGDVGAEIDPGLQAQKAAGRVLDLGQQDGDHREVAAAALGLRLPVESELDLALLPGAQTRRADEDNNCSTAGDGLFQGGQPRLAGGELVPIEEGGEAGLL
jgi:hypothetical protein